MSKQISKSQHNHRNYGLDIAKGICIILMVVGHSAPPKWLHDFIYVFHMPCFFIVSGMLFREKYLHDIGLFVQRRMKSLWWTFAIWTIIYVMLHNLLYNMDLYSNGYSSHEILKNILYAILMRKTEPLLGGFWFLRCLLLASLFSVLWLRGIGHSLFKTAIGIAFFLSLSLLSKLWDIKDAYFYYTNFLASAYFLTGRIIVGFEITRKFHRIIIAGAIIIVTIATIYVPVNMLVLNWQLIVPYFVISSLVSLGLIVICTKFPPHNSVCRWLMYVGARTLDILIFHFIIMKVVSAIKIVHLKLPQARLSDFPVIVDYNEGYWILYAVVGILGSLLIADIIHSVITYIKFSFKNEPKDKDRDS